MADFALAARSPLDGAVKTAAGGADITIAVQPTGAQLIVLARRGQAETLAERVRTHGLALPVRSGVVEDRGITAVATAPGQWLVLAQDGDAARRLFSPFAALCSVVTADDARLVMSVSGPRAPDVLAKVLTIDLHPRAFRAGDAAATVAAGISVLVWMAQEGRFACAVPRSLARSFWDWMQDAAAEFGGVAAS